MWTDVDAWAPKVRPTKFSGKMAQPHGYVSYAAGITFIFAATGALGADVDLGILSPMADVTYLSTRLSPQVQVEFKEGILVDDVRKRPTDYEVKKKGWCKRP